MRSVPVLLIVAGLLTLPTPAAASIITYTSEVNWEASTTGITSVNFEGIAVNGGFVYYPTPPGITRDGVNFTINHSESNGNLFVLGQGFSYPGVSVLSTQQSTATNNNMVITLPSASTSVGFNIGSFVIGTPNVKLTLSTGDVESVPIQPFPQLGFFGVTSTQPITSLEITDGLPNGFDLQSLSFGNGACAAALQNSVTPINGGTEMQADFTPNGGLSLGQAAVACGLTGFDWQQTITKYPDPVPSTIQRVDGIPITSGSIPYNDPPPGGGYTYCDPFFGAPCDSSPFYWNPNTTGKWNSLSAYEDINTLFFLDVPSDPCLLSFPSGHTSFGYNPGICNNTTAPYGSNIGFKTQLVGILPGGIPYLLPTDLNDSWTWTDNFNGTTGGIGVTASVLPVDPGSGDGGITITGGAGTATPEPSSIVLNAVGLTLLWMIRKKWLAF